MRAVDHGRRKPAAAHLHSLALTLPPPTEVHKDMLEHEEQHEQDEHEAEKVRAFKDVRNRLDQAIVNLDEMVLMFDCDI